MVFALSIIAILSHILHEYRKKSYTGHKKRADSKDKRTPRSNYCRVSGTLIITQSFTIIYDSRWVCKRIEQLSEYLIERQEICIYRALRTFEHVSSVPSTQRKAFSLFLSSDTLVYSDCRSTLRVTNPKTSESQPCFSYGSLQIINGSGYSRIRYCSHPTALDPLYSWGHCAFIARCCPTSSCSSGSNPSLG